MTEERKRRFIWGCMLLIGALGSASLRNNPALGITPLAVAVIDALIYICLLLTVRFSGWKMAVFTALITPVYLWAQRFLDGFMIPVDMLVNLALIGSMYLALKAKINYYLQVILLTAAGILAMLISGTAVLWIVKEDNLIHSFLIAWNTNIYSYFSLLGAALLSTPFHKTEARN